MAMKRCVAISALALVVVLTGNRPVLSQGCVAVRPMSCSASGQINNSGMLEKGQWQLSSSYRYFKSFRHFRGDVEEKHRVEEGTQVENITHAMDLGLTYGLSNRFGVALNLPVVYYDRSSLYEHYGNSANANPTRARFHTGATGIGDMRLTANYALFNPATATKGNVSIGMGIKMPTGDSDVQDVFHKRTADGRDSVITKAVDQSIQLGDGGWGINLEMSAFRQLFARGSFVFNAFYLANPKNMNSVPHSVADQYAARLCFNYAVLPQSGFFAGLGGRIEGVPSDDLIGKSEGFRRPGYIISIEPSLTYASGVNFTLNFPIALYRNRVQSYSDKLRTRQTGVFTNGDAAFADYLVNLVVSYKFGKKHAPMSIPASVSIPND
jgi:hypothetical protein